MENSHSNPEQIKKGSRQDRFLNRNFSDYENHLFAFLIDLNLCLLPVYVWAVEFILILTGVISPLYFDLLFYVMYALLFVSSCVLLPLYTVSTRGQSVGYRLMGMRLCSSNKRNASSLRLVMRQLLGFGVPLMLFGYFFSAFGLLIWWGISAAVVLISPHQQTLLDWIFSLCLVYTHGPHAKAAQEPAQEAASPQAQQEETQPDSQESAEQTAKGSASEISPIDLHIRSNFSDDGSTDVETIIKTARQQGMEVISITDHNCARANSQALRFASMYGIQYIPGVEIDAALGKQRVRILGYYIDWADEVFNRIEQESLKREKDSSLERVRAFEALMSIRIDVDSILSRSRFQIITPEHLTYMVFTNPRTRQNPLVVQYLERYPNQEQKARRAFRKEIFEGDGPCAVNPEYPDAKDIIQSIHDAGGLAVLACWRTGSMGDEVFEGLLEAGLDGVEAFMPDLPEETMTFLLALSAQEKLFVTAGSDYHGPERDRKIGVTGCPSKGLAAVKIFTKALD